MKVQAASFSNIATVNWDSDLKVYYQADDLTIRELTRNGATGVWSYGTTIPSAGGATPYEGTAIAAVGIDGVLIDVFYQASDANLWQATMTIDQWSVSEVVISVGPGGAAQLGTPIAAVRALNIQQVRVSFGTADDCHRLVIC